MMAYLSKPTLAELTAGSSPFVVPQPLTAPASVLFTTDYIKLTFPAGLPATLLTAAKITINSFANVGILPGVRGAATLYCEIKSSAAISGAVGYVIDCPTFRGFTNAQLLGVRILRRVSSSSAWEDILTIGGVITNRATDGLNGRFTFTMPSWMPWT